MPDLVTFRSFDDTEALRNSVFDSVLNTARNLQPVQNNRYTLSISDVDWQDEPAYNNHDIYNARLKQQSLTRKLQGTWNLHDTQTGKLLQKSKKILANVPYVLDNGGIMDSGNCYYIRNQQRLKHGIYTRKKENGELVSNINTASHEGPTHAYNFDPRSGKFNMEVSKNNVPLYTFLNAMGASDEELEAAWGKHILDVNKSHAKDMNMRKLYDRFVQKKYHKPGDKDDDQLMRQRIQEQAAAIKFAKEVNRATLGLDSPNYDKHAAIAASAKLLKLAKGEVESDSRDNMAFQSFYGPEDLFAERLRLDDGRVRRQLLNKLTFLSKNNPNLSKIPSGLLSKQINSVITNSGLASPAEEINPFEQYSKLYAVTRMGAGAIGCHTDQTDVFTYEGWKNWADVTSDDLLGCCIDGELEFHKPEKLFESNYSGDIYVHDSAHARIKYAVTPDHRMWVQNDRHNSKSKTFSKSPYHFETAEQCHLKRRIHKLAFDAYKGGKHIETYDIPPADKASVFSRVSPFGLSFASVTFAEFMGYYLADGYCSGGNRGEFSVCLAKLRTDKMAVAYESVFNAMGFKPVIRSSVLRIRNKALYRYVEQFGKSQNKFVPDWIKYGSYDIRNAFLTALFAGDGCWLSDNTFYYSSASKQLRDDAAYIAITLGKAIRFRDCQRKDYTQKSTGKTYKGGKTYGVVIIPNHEVRIGTGEDCYRVEKYVGKVYCATVPGGLLLTRYKDTILWSGNSLEAVPDSARAVNNSQYGFLDPLQTPESLRAGVDLYMSSSALKGSDNNLYIPVVNARTGKKEYKNPVDLMESVVTLQSEWNSPENKIAAFDRDRQPRMGINRDDVDYIFPNNQAAFNNLSNLVPMIGSVKGQRVAMAARMLTQALPIEAAEAPLVQSKIPGTEDESYEDRVGRFATVNSKVDGMVRKITDREIVIDTADGQKKYPLVQNMATNRKTYISNTPVVQPGQQIKAGQVLAKSNYTDDTGALAQGLNARAVVMPWRGANTLDGIVVSQSFANRMKSQHAYQHRIDWSDNIKQGKKTFIGAFPSAYDKEQLETIEDNGVVKIGTTVNQGDPLVLKADVNSKPVDRIHRKGATSLMNSALEWDHEDPGVVVDVHNDKNSVNVVVSSLQPMKVADKLANRYGAKGVINEIVPDDQMPITPDGPAEVIYSPIGNIGRVNYAMLHEHVLGRIAKKLGKPIKVEAFNPDNSDTAAWVMRLAKEHNISPREILTDPETGKQLTGLNGKGVGFGYSYVQKLHHSAEGKSSERSFGRYTADEQPACLQAGSQVLTRDGLFFIETLVDKRVDVWTGFNWASAVGVCKGQHQLAEIELENGTVIRCDTKHKLKNEMDEWVDFEFLRVGQLVSVSS